MVTDLPVWNPDRLREIGIVIADKQEGPFRLELAAVTAWTDLRKVAGSQRAMAGRTQAMQRWAGEPRAASDWLDQWRGTERLLVVSSPRILGADASKLMGQFLASGRGMAERDVRVVHLMGPRYGRVAGMTIGPKVTSGLRQAWGLDANKWQVALVGKDGSVKARWDGTVEPQEVFSKIDGMPMRQREAQERRGPRVNGPVWQGDLLTCWRRLGSSKGARGSSQQDPWKPNKIQPIGPDVGYLPAF